MFTKARGYLRRGNVEAAFRYARWAPTLAFLSVYAAGGDFSYLSCAAAFSIWPTLRSVNYS
jgi:hypothetical protein